MSEIPAFNVRSYPPFRMARLYRAYVDHEALYWATGSTWPAGH
jgi:hypothetical protein